MHLSPQLFIQNFIQRDGAASLLTKDEKYVVSVCWHSVVGVFSHDMGDLSSPRSHWLPSPTSWQGWAGEGERYPPSLLCFYAQLCLVRDNNA